MNKLIKIELERAFKNKMLIISVAIGLIIVGFNIWNEIIPARKTLDKLLEMGKYSGIQLPGLYMKWMGVRPGSYFDPVSAGNCLCDRNDQICQFDQLNHRQLPIPCLEMDMTSTLYLLVEHSAQHSH